jgi:hypothetical protein
MDAQWISHRRGPVLLSSEPGNVYLQLTPGEPIQGVIDQEPLSSFEIRTTKVVSPVPVIHDVDPLADRGIEISVKNVCCRRAASTQR